MFRGVSAPALDKNPAVIFVHNGGPDLLLSAAHFAPSLFIFLWDILDLRDSGCILRPRHLWQRGLLRSCTRKVGSVSARVPVATLVTTLARFNVEGGCLRVCAFGVRYCLFSVLALFCQAHVSLDV